jgi:polar amino acid transport system substrate-binding protein
MPLPSDTARAELVPQGKLRLAFPVGSALYVRKDAATGALGGLSIDIGNALSARLGVPFAAKPYNSVRELMAAVGSGEWDIATIVIDDERQALVDYSKAYLEADSTYLVPAGSTIRKVTDADKPGTRIAVAEKSAFDYVLTRMLKQASLVRCANVTAAVERLRTQDCEAAAAPRQVLSAFQAKLPGSCIVEDWFDVSRVGIAAAKGEKAAGIAYLNQFLTDVMTSGWLAQAIARNGMIGATVAPR